MTVKDLLDSLYHDIATIDVADHAPRDPIEKWEKVVGVMDESMKRVYARIVQLTLECQDISARLARFTPHPEEDPEREKDMLKLSCVGRAITLHEALLELLLFNSFPEIVDCSGLEPRRGWKVVALPPEELSLTPEERYKRYVEEPFFTIH